ncbi:DUF4259 domain-containing protein [Streptomyces sp. NPDC016640]|uniref:DUF4259 domain-containing protein n=1 Tax=Streptomyces sp. NPDC016640 TaxID=3364969 RepID=UPI0036F80154
MGTWGTGPFDSDLTADFVGALEGLTHQQVIGVLERAFSESPARESASRAERGPKPLPSALSSPAPSRTAPS